MFSNEPKISVEVRQATSEDAEQATKVMRDSIRELCEADHSGNEDTISEWTANKTTENLEKWFASQDSYSAVAISKAEVAGVGMISKSGEVLLLYVSPGQRFKGISKAILEDLEDYARREGLKETTLDSSATAKAFYEARAYQASAEAIESFGDSLAYPMKKDL